ncbi:unnamed protein product [Ilex paraguariensis]|uniref:Uncharacterized protein n=1 Tax=Ilex paraguariensis TaxID=185542 RepID=A0ABC8RN57_9AQUA
MKQVAKDIVSSNLLRQKKKSKSLIELAKPGLIMFHEHPSHRMVVRFALRGLLFFKELSARALAHHYLHVVVLSFLKECDKILPMIKG